MSAVPAFRAALLFALLAISAAASAQVAGPIAVANHAPSTLVFSGQSMATASPAQAITVTNAGDALLSVASVGVSAHFAHTHNCANIAPGASCTIHVAFTPDVAAGALNTTLEVMGTLTVTSNAVGSPGTVIMTGTAEKSLVTHYYRSILRRAPDAAGKAFWAGEAARVAGLGADVNEAWFAMAQSFFASTEYALATRTPTAYVTDLYRTFFNRDPDAAGLAYWVGQVDGGLPREQVMLAFMFSEEFSAFTQDIFGKAAASPEVDTVMDIYRGLLGRLPDTAGFAYVVTEIRRAQCQGSDAVRSLVEDILGSFIGSDEYRARGRTHAQYVGDLYNALLRRGGDRAGMQFWVDRLDSGALTRGDVKLTILASAEFNRRVDAMVSQPCLS